MNQLSRRRSILEDLKTVQNYITGKELASRYGVSRQIIVSDIAYLKSQGHDITSSKNGYLMTKIPYAGEAFKRTIYVYHDALSMGKEVRLIVENGAVVDNVFIRHPIYGEITVELMLKSLADCQDFSENMDQDEGHLLADLTGGYHYHVISAKTEKILDNAVEDLRKHGFLAE